MSKSYLSYFPRLNVSLRPMIFAPVLMLVCICLVTQAEATDSMSGRTDTLKGKAIGIVISRACLISPNCLDYSDIVGLDSSIPKYSGDFVEKNGDVIRQNAPYQDQYRFYQYDATPRIFVDPPAQFKVHIPLITIETQLDTYFLSKQMKKEGFNNSTYQKLPTQSIRSYSHTRFVDDTCNNAVITAKDWKKVLPDTINYLRSGCDPKQTQIATVTDEIKPLVQHDIATSYKYKLDKFYECVKKTAPKEVNKCKALDPNLSNGNERVSKK